MANLRLTPDEIRAIHLDDASETPGNNIRDCAFFLQEIAAQLAELNQNLRDLHPELNLPEDCRRHKCDYYTAYMAYGSREDDMSHEAYHEQVRAGSEHFKNCTYNGPGICLTCESYEKRLRA